MKTSSFTLLSLAVFCLSMTGVPAAEPAKTAEARPAENLTPAQAAQLAKRAAQEAAQKRAREARERQTELRNLIRSFPGKNTFASCIRLLKEELKKPDYAADPVIRLMIHEQIIQYCRTPGWTAIPLYDPRTADTELVPAARAIIDDQEIAASKKITAFHRLAEYYAGLKDFKQAEAAAREAIALPDLADTDRASTWIILSDVRRWNEDYAGFKQAVGEAMKLNPGAAARQGARIALRYGKADEAAAFWKTANLLYEELDFYSEYNPRSSSAAYGGIRGVPLSDRTEQARAFVMDEQNPAEQRFDIASKYCMEGMDPADVAARRILVDLPATSKASRTFSRDGIARAYRRGDYPLTVELCELAMDTAPMKSINNKLIYVTALGAIGRTAEAITRAEAYAADPEITPVQKAKLQFFAAILAGRNTDQILKHAQLTNKEEYSVLLSVARQCMVWGRTDLAEIFSTEYEKYFAMPETRVLAVKYLDAPVNNISDWRQVYGTLERQYCNIPYKGALDFFETDVATGERNVKFDPAEKPLGTTGVSAAADRNGLHVFLRIEAENAREVEQGFARAVSPECYFAPGHNQPYVCFGVDPVAKSDWMFYTTYDAKNNTRITKDKPDRSFRVEYGFSDTDYVIHLFFAWEPHYNKLPENGTEWLFEAICWTPAGGMTWGGSQGPHAVSRWGRLRFALNRKQLNEIRKEIIFKTYKGYKNILFGGSGGKYEDVFACWEAEVIGDPEFYRKSLAPLKEKLAAYAAMVRKDMTDEAVEEVYVNAIPLMKGLRYEVEDLRRKHLEEALMQ